MRISAICLALIVLNANTASAATVMLSDFIADDTRTNFVSFEGLPAGCCSVPTYVEDGVSVRNLSQGRSPSDADRPGNNISSQGGWGNPGQSWYLVNGDYGYTQIRRVGGLDFASVGFLRGSSDLNRFLAYALLNDGVVVLSGTVAHGPDPRYLGFSGGGFDEILLRDRTANDPAIDDNTYNALLIDNIELADTIDTGSGSPVPEPASWLLLGGGLTAVIVHWRRKRHPSRHLLP